MDIILQHCIQNKIEILLDEYKPLIQNYLINYISSSEPSSKIQWYLYECPYRDLRYLKQNMLIPSDPVIKYLNSIPRNIEVKLYNKTLVLGDIKIKIRIPGQNDILLKDNKLIICPHLKTNHIYFNRSKLNELESKKLKRSYVSKKYKKLCNLFDIKPKIKYPFGTLKEYTKEIDEILKKHKFII